MFLYATSICLTQSHSNIALLVSPPKKHHTQCICDLRDEENTPCDFFRTLTILTKHTSAIF